MIGHLHSEHDDGVHLPSEMIFKDLRATWGEDELVRTYATEANVATEMDVDYIKSADADEDPDLNRKRALAGRGNSPAASPTTSNAKGQLLLTASGQSVPPSPSAKQDLKGARIDQNSNKQKNMSSLAGSQAERGQDKRFS